MFKSSLETVGTAVVERLVELPGGWMSKVRFLETVSGYRTSRDLLSPHKMIARGGLRLTMWLDYSTERNECAMSERDFASSFLRVVNSVSAGKVRQTHAVLWIARGVGDAMECRDGVSRWRRFHVAGQVMRGGKLMGSHFELGEPGWDVFVDTKRRKDMSRFWRRVREQIGCDVGGDAGGFTVIRDAKFFKELANVERVFGGSSEECCDSGCCSLCVSTDTVEQCAQAELAMLHKTNLVP
jgi:hypothetical protein